MAQDNFEAARKSSFDEFSNMAKLYGEPVDDTRPYMRPADEWPDDLPPKQVPMPVTPPLLAGPPSPGVPSLLSPPDDRGTPPFLDRPGVPFLLEPNDSLPEYLARRSSPIGSARRSLRQTPQRQLMDLADFTPPLRYGSR
jgi:hypothetical protein